MNVTIKLSKIALCIITGFSVVFVLFIKSEKLNHSRNGFVRLFPSHFVSEGKMLDIKYNSYYIAGIDNQSIYLGNKIAPAYMLLLNHTLNDSVHILLSIPNSQSISWSALRIVVDSPYIDVFDRVNSSCIQTDTRQTNYEFYKLGTEQFSSALPISTFSIVMKKYNIEKKQSVLTKISLRKWMESPVSYNLSNKMEDFFPYDGMLVYDTHGRHLVFMNFYRNEFICLDSNLTEIYKAKTIDTVTIAKIKVANLSTEKLSMLASPPFIVNKACAAFGNYLFVNSQLVANNEDIRILDKHSVIDMYSIKDGRYKFSFYIPAFQNKKYSSFSVFSNEFIAIYDHFVVTYKLNLD